MTVENDLGYRLWRRGNYVAITTAGERSVALAGHVTGTNDEAGLQCFLENM